MRIVIIFFEMQSDLSDSKKAEAMIAATLVLMTSFAESRCSLGAARICEHLLRLSANPALPWELRTVIAKLGARWTRLQESVAVRAERLH